MKLVIRILLWITTIAGVISILYSLYEAIKERNTFLVMAITCFLSWITWILGYSLGFQTGAREMSYGWLSVNTNNKIVYSENHPLVRSMLGEIPE